MRLNLVASIPLRQPIAILSFILTLIICAQAETLSPTQEKYPPPKGDPGGKYNYYPRSGKSGLPLLPSADSATSQSETPPAPSHPKTDDKPAPLITTSSIKIPPKQETAPLQDTPGGMDTSLYRLQYTDKIEISIWNEPDMTREVVVGPDGRISYLLVGSLFVVGKTFSEVEQLMTEKLASFIIDPHATVIGIEYAGHSVVVLGKVSRPGRVEISRNSHVLDALAKTGGILSLDTSIEEVADLKNAYLNRKGQFIAVDFMKLFAGDATQNVRLEPDDFIYIPPANDNKVFVLGEVSTPGIVRFTNRISLIEALSDRGGVTYQGKKYQIFVMKGGPQDKSPMIVNYRDIVTGKAPNVELSAGDVVFVPETFITRLERVSGQVSNFMQSLLTGKDVEERVIR
ncbi:MAG: polysaccharide biosynthesis/export family protein [Planctomycetes bacterium]|nr:polysaccharide biosynthesis/export family protein [Planctomycetota bacterium]